VFIKQLFDSKDKYKKVSRKNICAYIEKITSHEIVQMRGSGERNFTYFLFLARSCLVISCADRGKTSFVPARERLELKNSKSEFLD